LSDINGVFRLVLGKGVEHLSTEKEDAQPRYRIKNTDTRQEYP